MKEIMRQIQEEFGELKVEWHVFTNCGIRHIQDKTTMEITLDQIVFAGNLRPIVNAQLRCAKAAYDCNPELHKLYTSLVGAVAYLAHTRVDIVGAA